VFVETQAETNYKARDGSFFSLEAVWFLLQRADEAHAKYIIECKNLGMPCPPLSSEDIRGDFAVLIF
jgi:hypothetical protein